MLGDGVDAFDPVVDDWNEAAQENERKEREDSDYVLYVLTPQMAGAYSVAEVVEDSVKQPDKTLFAVIEDGGKFDAKMMKSLEAVKDMVTRNKGKVFDSLDGIAEFLNGEGSKVSKEAAIKPEDLNDAEVAKMDMAFALLQLLAMVADDQKVNIPGYNALSGNLEKKKQMLRMRTRKFTANKMKVRKLLDTVMEYHKEIEKMEKENPKGSHPVGAPAPRMASEGVETPESSKREVPEVMEVEASSKKDVDPKKIYKDRSTKRKPGEKLPENRHTEMEDLFWKKRESSIDFGERLVESDLTDKDAEDLGKLY